MNIQEKTLLQVRDKAIALWAPPEELTILEWAEKYRVVANGTSSRPGKFEALPHQRYVLQHLGTTYSEMVGMLPAQLGGKTEIELCMIGYYMHHDPSPILIKYPTQDAAETFSKAKLAPMIEATPVLRKCVVVSKSRDSGNTIRTKKFIGGELDLAGAESPSALRGKTKRVIGQDEIDADAPGAEGDPVALADKRSTTYPNAVKFKISTPTEKGGSRIEDAYENSTRGKWTVECPHCKFRQWFKWGQMKWEAGKEDEAYLECGNPECRKVITDDERIAAYYKTGDYVFDNPTHTIGGVWGNGITLGVIGLDTKRFKNYYHQWVTEFLAAKRGGPETLRVWVNTFLCESWEEEADNIKPEGIKTRVEDYKADVPKGVALLTAEVDIQGDRLEAQITGWGLNDHSWGIEYRIFMGDPNFPNVWETLQDWLRTPRVHANGTHMLPYVTVFDTGHKNTLAYEFVRKHTTLRYYAIKGSSLHAQPLVSRPTKSGVKRVKLFMVGSDTAKGVVYSRLKVEDPADNGYCHFPIGRGFDDEYFAQLTAEKVTTKYSYGKKIQVWKKTRERNEALDLKAYSLAAVFLATSQSSVRIDKLAAVMQVKDDAIEAAEEEDKADDSVPRAIADDTRSLEEIKASLAQGRVLREDTPKPPAPTVQEVKPKPARRRTIRIAGW